MLLFWKNKPWANRIIFLGWENTHTHQISADHNTKEYGSKEELLILKDNLYDQAQKKYKYMCWEVDNNLCWYCHLEYTDYLDPPETGAGNHIRFWFGFYLYECIWDCGNVELWYLSLFPDYQKQIFITKLLIKERRQIFHRLNLLRDISLRWGVVCPLLDKKNTWFSHISYYLVIIYLSMFLITIMLLFCYIPLQRVQIHHSLILQMRRIISSNETKLVYNLDTQKK